MAAQLRWTDLPLSGSTLHQTYDVSFCLYAYLRTFLISWEPTWHTGNQKCEEVNSPGGGRQYRIVLPSHLLILEGTCTLLRHSGGSRCPVSIAATTIMHHEFVFSFFLVSFA